ncbi:hypothetical protein WDV85_03140 [Pseudokineococcus sp. 5B2Z-1]|uniref:hypothetical protein n=1 Tax=Pseudokineococcus sp. 5B2Z-1 TaxID=3132744 RepID=UPI003094AE7C
MFPSAVRNVLPTPPGSLVVTGSPANDGFSGVMPESMTPTTTPSPVASGPPSWAQTPSSPVRPRKAGLSTVSRSSATSRSTLTTPRVAARAVACSAVSSAEKPLTAAVYWYSGSASTTSATSSCWRSRKRW